MPGSQLAMPPPSAAGTFFPWQGKKATLILLASPSPYNWLYTKPSKIDECLEPEGPSPMALVALAVDSSDISICSPSPSKAITQFYTSINEKNLKQLGELLADDCFLDDYSFPKPFEEKKDVIKFLEQLITSMGQNMEFNIENICEGDDLTAAVNWHLDWKKKQVPFTRGCSYFGLSRDGERLVIKKVQAVIESPIKPGGLALALFKIVTSLFDAFPDAAERFLKSPYVIFQLLLKIYNIILQPILNPILTWYLKLWSFTVGIISFMLKILQYIAKIINM